VLILLVMPPLTGSVHAENTLKTLLGFAVGGLLGDVFLHLLPHTYEAPHGGDHAEHDHSHGTFVGLSLLAGVLVFFVIEKWVRSKAASYGGGGDGRTHTHSHGSHAGDDPAAKGKKPKQKKKANSAIAGVDVTGWLNLVADFSHNFTDGLAIGASFAASERLGYVTTVAVLVHEVPHEIGDYAILVKSGMSKRGAILSQLFTATGCLLGTVISLLASSLASSSKWILPFTAGGFIYIACTTVLPDLLQDNSFKQSAKEVIGFLTGVGMMVLVAMLE
jgi:zinc transporter 7